MDPLAIIEKYYKPFPELHQLYLTHVRLVRDKALEIAGRLVHLNPDKQFIDEASMLHDIGIYRTDLPLIYCRGSEPYLAHGHIGRQILEKEGYPRHALVAERHTGSGITALEITERRLPLPVRDMLPITLEEKIICYADCFYSKHPETVTVQKALDEVREGLAKFGKDSLTRFDALHELCAPELVSNFVPVLE